MILFEVSYLIHEFQGDEAALERLFPIHRSVARRERFDRLYADWQKRLEAANFDALNSTGRVDLFLFENLLRRERRKTLIELETDRSVRRLISFADDITELVEARVRMEPLDPREAAKCLSKTEKLILLAKESLDSATDFEAYGFLATESTEELRTSLQKWFAFYDGYDPLFSWWVRAPYKAVDEGLDSLLAEMRSRFIDSKGAIPGFAVGRDALLADLEFEQIPYSPEELIEMGEREYTWCEEEMKKASAELGFGPNWGNAVEHVKGLHLPPGEQPSLVVKLAREAIDFLESQDLVTIPDLAKETWRMEMMSPEAQKVNPFFLGGEKIIVSYPTDAMSHEEKLMSMRGNNPHFSRATVQHELIPGHHLQQFMTQRYRSYRSAFYTPFWIEGWALHWEMLLWDLGFAQKPEDRIGMLFWRMHRCVRIAFSLRFHLGELTTEDCVDMLLERVGHERANAEGEVRRSFNGSYPPLYQAAYMIGGLQLRSLYGEFVLSGKMSPRAFHDRVLQENEMPWTVLRSILAGEPMSGEGPAPWRF